MDINFEPVKNWFGFTRRERRATLTLLFIIVFIIGLRYTIPDKPIAIDDLTGTITVKEKNHKNFDATTKIAWNHSEKSPETTVQIKHGRKSDSNSQYKNIMYKNSGIVKTRIDLNTCDSAALLILPGIGPVLSGRIIKYRHLIGGYARVGQLKEVYGLKEETFEVIKDKVSVDSSAVKRIDINSAGYKEIVHLPYLGKYEITSILKYRQLKGKISDLSELVENKIISTETAEKVRPYIIY